MSATPLLSVNTGPALKFDLMRECKTSLARQCRMLFAEHCSNGPVETPVFMPVGTQGTIKGVTVEQLEGMDCRLLLGNTYHLGHRPGTEVLDKAGGLHSFMSWRSGILTDSGGFQMVSLNDLSTVDEQGVTFTSPHNATRMLLTPEESVGRLQASLGSDIVMQLDHVLHVLTDDTQLDDAMERSVRWLDRAVVAHEPQKYKQNLYAILQGGLSENLRKRCIDHMLPRKDQVQGFAIGGLSGGEAKDDFWRTVLFSTRLLPRGFPRYLMGVGYPVDLIVCVALGCDQFDCVYPTRTGRFGLALVSWGQVNLRLASYKFDFGPIDPSCPCPACSGGISRSWLHTAFGARQANASSYVSMHNLTYLLGMMRTVREAIGQDRFPEFVRDFFQRRCKPSAVDAVATEYEFVRPPGWCIDALNAVNIDISNLGTSN